MEEEILSLFLFNKELRFSDMEKKLRVRSNKLAYHLKNLVKKEILDKSKDCYSLNENHESLIPYFSENKSPLPVLLIHLGNETQAFLYKREKRPYKDYLSLPGGRLLIGESIAEGAKRIMREKFSILIESPKIKSLSLEHVKKEDKTIHSFILILVQAKTKNKNLFVSVNSNKSKIIPSDYQLIKSKIQNSIQIKTIISKD